MIKAVIGEDVNNKKVVILGLSGENVTRLVAGEPILFDGSEIGLPGNKFLIMYGRTEFDICADLQTELGVNLPC
jgi:hypothetical protein